MATIQCKMCGGSLSLPENVFSGTCPYCGTLSTFPRTFDDQLVNLYNRAEHFRRTNDYDKAVATYEQVINNNPDDPEAYWGLVLSRFGIEYVEDPVSHERIPTCHRVQFDSILADADYHAALERAGETEKSIYQMEAARIAEIQKNILAISNNEEPFDVFICYKESDENGARTKDSVVAQDIYYALTNEGLKVFFARITLEGKLGQQYEPYIFAALNSAKAMLVIGSRKEFFNAVWVKNEWSRFMALMKKDRSKLIIPCYKDMDAYDIPEELSMFQAQDMGKIGFVQDILHGLKKVAAKQQSPAAAPAAAAPATGKNNPLLRRALLFFESGDFASALQYCEKALDQEPESGWAYFYRLKAELKSTDDTRLYAVNFLDHSTFQLAQRFADDELKQTIGQLIEGKKVYDQAKAINQTLRTQAAARYNTLAEFRKRLNAGKKLDAEIQQCVNNEGALLNYSGFLTEEMATRTRQQSEGVVLRLIELEKKKKRIALIVKLLLTAGVIIGISLIVLALLK